MHQALARVTKIWIISGSLRVRAGTVEAAVFQKTAVYPDEYAHGFRVTLDASTWVMVRRDPVISQHF